MVTVEVSPGLSFVSIPSQGDTTMTRLKTILAFVTTAALSAGSAQAQVRDLRDSSADPARTAALVSPSPDARLVAPVELPSVQPIRDAVTAIDVRAVPDRPAANASAQGREAGRERSVTRRVLGGAVGAAAGFFGGGYLGAAIEGDGCHCDDPGLKGALIGAPIGAVTGGILGAMFLF
jgi:hypothetical protein